MHDVEVRAEGVYVRLCLGGDLRSDKYAYRPDCAAGLGRGGRRSRRGAGIAGADGRRVGAGGMRQPPSGRVFFQQRKP